jgi:multidrug transporter EmrE-like cation transporter
MTPWLYVAVTLALTVYGQLVVKWQVERAGALPASLGGKLEFLARLLANPWVVSALAGALVAALAWMAAMTKLELSRAYPWMGLSFILVLVFSAVLFDEPFTAWKVAGLALVVAGLVVGTRV